MPAPGAADPFDDDRGYQKRKLKQLCRQVERVMMTALADRADERLQALQVQEVLPWPNASRLLVIVTPSSGDRAILEKEGGVLDREKILMALEAERPDLRQLVAERVNRKRAPDLSFELMDEL